jgi:NADPH2:quinone reductase
MRAAIVHEFGHTPQVGEFDEPRAGEGELELDVLAGGLNPVDLTIATGRFYGGTPPLPYVPGMEGVGRTGDGRVVYFDASVRPFGSFAQRTLVRAEDVFELPEQIAPSLATCFGVAGLAAWLSLTERGRLAAGETVLVLGASGVVGLIAVQAARLLGAGRVVAATRDAEALARAGRHGADATVQIGAVEDLPGALREACGGDGADVVIDPVWGEPAAAALLACAIGARMVQLGQSAGAEATLPSAAIRGRLVSIVGHTNVHMSREVKREAYLQMVEHAVAGRLTVPVQELTLDELPQAWANQRSSPHHKQVVVPG